MKKTESGLMFSTHNYILTVVYSIHRQNHLLPGLYVMASNICVFRVYFQYRMRFSAFCFHFFLLSFSLCLSRSRSTSCSISCSLGKKFRLPIFVHAFWPLYKVGCSFGVLLLLLLFLLRVGEKMGRSKCVS